MIPMHGGHSDFHVQWPAVQPQTQPGIDKHFFFEQTSWFPTKFWRHPLQIWKDEGCPYIAMHMITSMLGLRRMCFHLSPMYQTNVRRNYRVTLWPSMFQCQTSDTKSRGTKCCHSDEPWWAPHWWWARHSFPAVPEPKTPAFAAPECGPERSAGDSHFGCMYIVLL